MRVKKDHHHATIKLTLNIGLDLRRLRKFIQDLGLLEDLAVKAAASSTAKGQYEAEPGGQGPVACMAEMVNLLTSEEAPRNERITLSLSLHPRPVKPCPKEVEDAAVRLADVIHKQDKKQPCANAAPPPPPPSWPGR